MRQPVAWILLPIALGAGVAAGFYLRSKQVKTVITTLVQIQTVAPPPPATHQLLAIVQGPNDTCLSSDTDSLYADITSHAFTLRRPGNGDTEGDVVAVAERLAMDNTDCDLDVMFKISPKLGFFVVSDDTDSNGDWGPFDSHQLSARQWTLHLDESS